MEIIRNLTRRKLRNILTISGIVIGVLRSWSRAGTAPTSPRSR